MSSLPQNPEPNGMTATERRELAAFQRKRERVAKSAARALEAQRVADAEAKLATEFAADDERWAGMVARAKREAEAANEAIRAICVEEGFPARFAPSYQPGWRPRGENFDPERRAELRRVVKTYSEARLKAAFAEIERDSVAIQERILAGAFSPAALAALGDLLSIEDLLPEISVAELKSLADREDQRRADGRHALHALLAHYGEDTP